MRLKFLSEEAIKQQLHLDDDVMEAQSEAIEMMARSAEDKALNFIGRTMEDLYEEYGEVPAPIQMACLAEIASNYTVRENEEDRTARTVRIKNYNRWEMQLMPYRRSL